MTRRKLSQWWWPSDELDAPAAHEPPPALEQARAKAPKPLVPEPCSTCATDVREMPFYVDGVRYCAACALRELGR